MASPPITLESLLDRYNARPIRNCPGRYVLAGRMTQMPPNAIVGDEYIRTVYTQTASKDTVIVTRIDDWGLISYHREDGSWCHTANTPEGFARKLSALGVKTAG